MLQMAQVEVDTYHAQYSFSINSVKADLSMLYSIAQNHNIELEIGAKQNLDFLDSTNVSPYSVHLSYDTHMTEPTASPELIEQEVDEYLAILDKAKEAGAQLCVLHTEGHERPYTHKERFDSFFKNMKPVFNRAQELGLTMAIENQLYWPDSLVATPKALRYVIDTLREDYDNIGVCLDIGHAYISGEDDRTGFSGTLDDWLDIFREDIVHAHVHENHGAERYDGRGNIKDEHLPPSGLFADSFYQKLASLPNIKVLNFELSLKAPEIEAGVEQSIAHLEKVLGK